MAPGIATLVIEPDPDAARQFEAACRRLGTIDLRWKTESLEAGAEIVAKRRPEMVVVGIDRAADPAIGFIEAVSGSPLPPFILALSGSAGADLILRTMRAGAHDFLCRPIKDADLSAAVEKVGRLRSAKGTGPSRGRIVSLFGGKGGCGATTIAVNLSGALVRCHDQRVVVVDLVLAHGDVTLFFNVNPAYSILDLARNAEKADSEFLHTLLVKHESGVHVLAAPHRVEEADQIDPGQVRQVLATLRGMFDYIVVDTPRQFDERTLCALEMSDLILLPTLLDLPSIRNAQRCLDLFEQLGIRDDRVKLVLSRFLPGERISPEKIEQVLKCPVFASVPNDFPTVIGAINRGRPLQESAPDKEVTLSFRRMADLLTGGEAEAPEPRKPGLLGRILNL
jgi:pilus assembly protein CpaE